MNLGELKSQTASIFLYFSLYSVVLMYNVSVM